MDVWNGPWNRLSAEAFIPCPPNYFNFEMNSLNLKNEKDTEKDTEKNTELGERMKNLLVKFFIVTDF